jgi:hypothetical protein
VEVNAGWVTVAMFLVFFLIVMSFTCGTDGNKIPFATDGLVHNEPLLLAWVVLGDKEAQSWLDFWVSAILSAASET